MLELRNPYKHAPPNFATLAEAVPAFAPFLRKTAQGHPTIDFKDEKALRALTAALLERDFNLKISLPADRLCPIVPGRLEYVLWILQVALRTSASSQGIIGIDMQVPPRQSCVSSPDFPSSGTGASAIYPLLACRTSPSIRMLATDIDQASLSSAKANVEGNTLQDRIRLVRVDPEKEIFPPDIFVGNIFDFCMCNPPFYSSAEDVKMSESDKELDPFAVCTGATVEMITPGGEVQFVTKIFKESQILGTRVRWYSSLFGKFSSVAHIVNLIKEAQITNYAVTELGQGYTKRWVVAWSYQDTRLPDSLARSESAALSKLIPPPNLASFRLVRHSTVPAAAQDLRSLLTTLNLEMRWVSGSRLEVIAQSNTWSRGARRKKARGEVAEPETTSSASPLLRSVVNLKETGGKVEFEAQWTQGTDRQAFSGLWLHVARKLGDAVEDSSSGMDVT